MQKLKKLIRDREKELKQLKDISLVKTPQKKVVDFNNTSFFDRISLYGYNDRNEKITLYNWHREYYNLLSNLDIAEIYITGAAQLGKTLPNYLLVCDLISQGYNTIWAYDQERNLNRCVPLQFRPIADNYLNSLGITISKGKAQNNTLYQTNKGNAIFTYTSTTKSSNSTKGAAAGSSVVSVTADVLFIEERSQHQIGSIDPLYRRLDAGKIPSHPVRQLGTPGNGNGIESEIEKADHYFYPAIICPHCKEEIFIDPKGCLLTPINSINSKGEESISYLSSTGKPNNNWFHLEENNPLDTAFFACSNCENPLDTYTLTKTSYFKDKYTGIKLSDFLNEFSISDKRLKIGLNLSPLLRESTFNLARDIIESGLNTANSDDWQQQRLGHPSISTEGNISIEMIKASINAKKPDRKPDFILAGIDQGRSSHWIMIIEYYLPHTPDYTISYTKNQRQDLTYRNVLIAKDVTVTEIPDLLQEYKVDFGIIDNEPDRDSTSRLCESTVLEMADQKGNTLKDIEKTLVLHGGIKYPCYKINNTKFLRRVLNAFKQTDIDNNPITILPDSWEKWVSNNSEVSPIRHLRSPFFNYDKNKWERTDHIDDLFYSFMFTEVAFSLYLDKSISFADIL